MGILDRIDSFILESDTMLFEAFSANMKEIIPSDVLARLGYMLNRMGLDVQKSEFTEFEKGSTTPGKMKDRFIICFYNEKNKYKKNSWAVIGNDDSKEQWINVDARTFFNDRKYTKKSLIEYADNIWIVTKANGASSYDIQRMRREAKRGAEALTRNSRVGYDVDKSGYDVESARDRLKNKAFELKKDKILSDIISAVDSKLKEKSSFLLSLSNRGFEKLEYADLIKIGDDMSKLFNVIRDLKMRYVKDKDTYSISKETAQILFDKLK